MIHILAMIFEQHSQYGLKGTAPQNVINREPIKFTEIHIKKFYIKTSVFDSFTGKLILRMT